MITTDEEKRLIERFVADYTQRHGVPPTGFQLIQLLEEYRAHPSRQDRTNA